MRTAEDRAKLEDIASRYEQFKQDYPDLSDSRFLNRLHAAGIKASEGDLAEALEFMLDQELPAVLTVEQAAELCGLTPSTFKGWFMPSYMPKSKTRPPKGTPVPVRANTSKTGVPATFTVESVKATADYLKHHV